MQKLVSGIASLFHPPIAAVNPHSSLAPPTGGGEKQKERARSLSQGQPGTAKEDASLAHADCRLLTDSALGFPSDGRGDKKSYFPRDLCC